VRKLLTHVSFWSGIGKKPADDLIARAVATSTCTRCTAGMARAQCALPVALRWLRAAIHGQGRHGHARQSNPAALLVLRVLGYVLVKERRQREGDSSHDGSELEVGTVPHASKSLRAPASERAGHDAGKLTGTVELDDTYVGGKPRYTGQYPVGRPSPDRKAPVVAMVERTADGTTGRVRMRVTADTSAKSLKSAVREHFTVDGTLLEAWASHKSVRPIDDPTPPPTDAGPSPGTSNPSVNWRGEQRTNQTHRSVTDPDARLARKSSGTTTTLCKCSTPSVPRAQEAAM
jgi:hypothetical protein